MEAYPGQTRMYVIVGALLGALVGAFMETLLVVDSMAVRYIWLVLFVGIGGLMGKLLVVAQAPERTESREETHAPDDPEVSATRFFKLQSGVFTDEELRRLRVRSVMMPMSPPDAELELQVRDYNHYCRVPVLEGVLERLTAREVFERALTEAKSRAPKVPGDLDLNLVSFHSEGPLGPDGRSPLGWSFYMVDGRHGLGCLATSTDREIALHFHTAATFSAPAEWDWVELEDVLKWAESALPEWADEDVRIRVIFPDDYLCFVANPLRVADIDIVEGVVINDAFLSEPVTPEDSEEFALDELVAWFRGGDLDDDSAFAAAVQDDAFADGLRTLAPAAIGRVAMGLERAMGPAVVPALSEAILLSEDLAECLELLHVLSRTPSGLAEVALHRLAVDNEHPEVASAASELHDAWRRGAIDVPRHPLDSLSFLDVRRRMGRGELAVVPLIPTYDPDGDLLPTLVELGFRDSRRRMLSGASNLLVGARLRSEESDIELLLTSTPLPVPCHILHVVGNGAERLAQRLRRTNIVYAPERIIADAGSGKPDETHRAALYIAALRLDDEAVAAPMLAMFERSAANAPLRRALVSALAVQSFPAAKERVAAIAGDADDADRVVASEALTSPAASGSVRGV